MRKSIIIAVVIVILVSPPAYAVMIGFFPGLDELINKADAIVILRVDRHVTDFGSPTLYSTHDCYIYQTLQGNIPTTKTIRLQLMDTRTSFVTPYAIHSTHLMFLTKKRTPNEPTDYRTIEIRGANIRLLPFGHEKMPAGKTTKDQVQSLLKRTVEYNKKQHDREQAFLNHMIKGTAEPTDLPHARPSTESELKEQSSSIPEKAKPSELANEFAEAVKSYLGEDLRCLDETEREQFNQLTSAFIPQPTTEEEQLAAILSGYDSWYVWQDGNDPGEQRFILFQVSTIMPIPGARAARVFVLDSTGDVLSQCELSLGWRIDAVDACWNADADRDFPCIEVSTAPVVLGRDIATQYYAILGNDVALVRMEDSQGRPIVQNYHNPNHTIGPPCPRRTQAEWESALQSTDMSEALRTLMWLGGRHSNPPVENPGNRHLEEAEDARLALDVRRSPTTEQAIETLAKSEDKWVLDAARQALRAVRETKSETHE